MTPLHLCLTRHIHVFTLIVGAEFAAMRIRVNVLFIMTAFLLENAFVQCTSCNDDTWYMVEVVYVCTDTSTAATLLSAGQLNVRHQLFQIDACSLLSSSGNC